jgi:hypothetical protein
MLRDGQRLCQNFAIIEKESRQSRRWRPAPKGVLREAKPLNCYEVKQKGLPKKETFRFIRESQQMLTA